MKIFRPIILFLLLTIVSLTAVARKMRPIEGAYYGTNYTVPFAHAYRALGYLGVDHREAIDRDVYHFSRLGFNAFRVHLWDVELTDSIGNLLENEHLQLLDYLISSLEKRNIKIILTAQTNFGNGYPERNSNPNNAYSYLYDKCQVHQDSHAIEAQKRYIQQLVNHVNANNGLSYSQDSSILAIEINNEPCHGDDAKQVTDYINAMAKTMRKAGWNKTVLYNVSHNGQVANAYFEADIDGTTYQWYPLNLVKGKTRRGNFLPFVDQYDIPFHQMPGYDKLSKVIYEFDPADNLLSYVYPAAARTFRKEGFQWATQFAYDPIDMAWANTEYQTHFLNLAYTPSKALGMMIAAEVMRQTPEGMDYGSFPADTIFGPFMLSAKQDLAVLNDGTHFYYTNPTTIQPADKTILTSIAGKGNSPLVDYQGSGAYFIDKIQPGLWRVEIMPDVVMTADPFAKPSLERRVAEIIYNERQFAAFLPDLNSEYVIRTIANGNIANAANYSFKAQPGVYLIGNDLQAVQSVDLASTYADGTKRIDEYVAPKESKKSLAVIHAPKKVHNVDEPLILDVQTIGDAPIDSVMLYPSTVSFWNSKNDVRKFNDLGYGHYQLEISDSKTLGGRNSHEASYSIVVWQAGQPVTYPQKVKGTPLSWDYDEKNAQSYTTSLYYPGNYLRLLTPNADFDESEISTYPIQWDGVRYRFNQGPRNVDSKLSASIDNPQKDTKLIVLKYVGDLSSALSSLPDDPTLCIELGDVKGMDKMELSLITNNGLSYNAPINCKNGAMRLKVKDFKLAPTILCPEPYPVFLSRIFTPDEAMEKIPLQIADLENIQIIGSAIGNSYAAYSIHGLWIE